MTTTYQLLSPPPVDNKVTASEKMSSSFQKYLTNVNASIQATIAPVTYTPEGTTQNATGAALQHPQYETTAEINSIQNPQNGMSVYNNETDKMNFRIAGIWEEWP